MTDNKTVRFKPDLKHPIVEMYLLWDAFSFAISRAIPADDARVWLDAIHDVTHDRVIETPIPPMTTDGGQPVEISDADIASVRRAVAAAVDAAFTRIDTAGGNSPGGD